MSFLTQGLKGEKTIPFESITTVQFKRPGALTSGYIQFGLLGGNESRSGLIDATKDENTVMFVKKAIEDADFIRGYIEQTKATKTNPQSGLDELRKLKGLLDDGIINSQEFELQKKKILGT